MLFSSPPGGLYSPRKSALDEVDQVLAVDGDLGPVEAFGIGDLGKVRLGNVLVVSYTVVLDAERLGRPLI